MYLHAFAKIMSVSIKRARDHLYESLGKCPFSEKKECHAVAGTHVFQ